MFQSDSVSHGSGGKSDCGKLIVSLGINPTLIGSIVIGGQMGYCTRCTTDNYESPNLHRKLIPMNEVLCAGSWAVNQARFLLYEVKMNEVHFA